MTVCLIFEFGIPYGMLLLMCNYNFRLETYMHLNIMLFKLFSLSFNSSRKMHILLFLFYVISKCEGQCEILQPTTPDETKREQELLNVIKPLFGSTFEAKDVLNPDKYTYKVSICSQIEGQRAKAGAVQIDVNKTHVLGSYKEVDIMGGTDWILLTYYGGDNYTTHCGNSSRKTNIMIICDPDTVKGNFEILEEKRKASLNNCYYLFELSSNVSCTAKHTKLSSGSVFCILAFTVVSVYLICGFLYKRIVVRAKGLEQIPNYTFWQDFGNLQADGCDYFCRWGSRQESQAYRGIDDHLKEEEEERDDQLLN